MAVVIARVAADQGLRSTVALDAVVGGWIAWLDEGASDVGTQTRQVLGTVAAGGSTRLWSAASSASSALHRRTGRTAGNGSLMRTAPVALAFLDDPSMLTLAARWVSEATHHDPLAGDACVLWCHAIRRAVLDGVVPDLAALDDVVPAARRDQWSAWIAEAERRPPADFSPNGYVVTALQAAWSAIRHPLGDGPPVVASLSAAVHAGDDTDTVAAIAGSLLGAAHGASALPAEWLEAVHGWPGLRAEVPACPAGAPGRGTLRPAPPPAAAEPGPAQPSRVPPAVPGGPGKNVGFPCPIRTIFRRGSPAGAWSRRRG